jgi:PTS system nitrogen regulatory IIA component
MRDPCIADFLPPNAVIADLAGRNVEAVLAELCQVLSLGVDAQPAQAVHALLERERLGSTGIGKGVAIPHARVAGLRQIITSFGRSKVGADFKAIDGKPVHFFFAVLTPEAAAGAQASDAHLRLLARISRIFSHPAFRDAVLQAPDAGAIYRLIVAEDEKQAA